MKKVFVLLLMLAVLLAGCAYTVETETGTITVKPSGTISDGTYEYYYYYNDDGSFFITYPNGVHCQFTKTGQLSGAWDGASVARYADPALLGQAVREGTNAPSKFGSNVDPGTCVAGIVMVLMGLGCIVFPRVPWYMNHGWAFENAEPSELGLKLPMIGGMIMTVTGILAVILSLFGVPLG